MTPAEELRTAARVMRERARAADTGERWEAERHYDALWLVDLKPSLGPVETPALLDDGLGIGGYAAYETPRFLPAFAPHAGHIAGMHPGVALAVADWLDSLDGIEWSEQAAAPDELTHALKIARAYLAPVPGGTK